MKKILISVLSLVALLSVCACLLCACEGQNDLKGEFFSEEQLNGMGVRTLPAPSLDSSVLRDGKTLYLNLTDEEYIAYYAKLIRYLRARTDIYNLSKVEHSTYVMIIPTGYICSPIGDGFVPSCESVDIMYSLTEDLGEDGELESPIRISLVRKSGTHTYSGFSYNCYMTISHSNVGSVVLDRCYYDHTYEEVAEYRVPSGSGMQFIKYYTCIYCGASNLSEFIGDMKYYKVSVDRGSEYIVRALPEEYISGIRMDVCVGKLHSDLILLVNGMQIEGYASDTDSLWHYTFVMPCQDITISIIDPSVPTIKELSEIAPWLGKLEASDIAQIKYRTSQNGAASGLPVTVNSTSDREKIEGILSTLKALEMSSSGYINNPEAGKVKEFVFVLSDGTARRIYFQEGGYAFSDNIFSSTIDVYHTDYIPSIRGTVTYSLTYFENLPVHPAVYDEESGDFTLREDYVIDLSELEFTVCTESELEGTRVLCKTSGAASELEIMGNTTFRIGNTCYKLVNTTFRDAFTLVSQ